MTKRIASYGAVAASAPLAPLEIERREIQAHDVQIKILFCGVCHSDLHTARNEWKGTVYPVVPGHEIVGIVTGVGKEVTKFQVGDLAAVGCMVDACHTCSHCREGLEQYCDVETIYTYNSPDKHLGTMTYGGYSTEIVVKDDFVLRIPKKFKENDLPGIAPLLCAGITTYSPLNHWKIKKGDKVGIVGLGGLGHMAIKIAHALGAHVVLFTTSPNKTDDAKRLGADEVILSKNSEEFHKHLNSFDFILDTVSASHQLDTYTQLLKPNKGTLCLVGVPEEPHPTPNVANLIMKRRSLAGSLIGGIKETQEMLDFCAEHGITADVEIIPIQKINDAYERMLKSDVKYRFVINMESLKS